MPTCIYIGPSTLKDILIRERSLKPNEEIAKVTTDGQGFVIVELK